MKKKARFFVVLFVLVVVSALVVFAQDVTVKSKAKLDNSGIVLRPIAGRHGIKVKTIKSAPDYDIISIELERDPGNVTEYKVPKNTTIVNTGYSEPPEVPGLTVFSNITNHGFLYHAQEPGGNNFFLHLQKVSKQKGSYKVEIHLNAEVYQYDVAAAKRRCSTIISDPKLQLNPMLDSMEQSDFARASLGALANEMLRYSNNDNLPYWVNCVASIFGDLVDVEALYPFVPPCYRTNIAVQCGSRAGCGYSYTCDGGVHGSGSLAYKDSIEVIGSGCTFKCLDE